MEKPGLYEMTALACGMALLAIWPLPHTMAPRNLLLVGGALTFLRLRTRFSLSIFPILFFGWVLAHLFISAGNWREQLYELHNVWFRAALAVCTGAGFGLTIMRLHERDDRAARLLRALFVWGIVGTSLIYFGYYIGPALSGHRPAEHELFLSLYGGKTAVIVFSNMALAALMIHCFGQEISGLNVRSFSTSLLLGIACFFSLFYSNTKNGLLIALAVMLLSVYFLRSLRERIGLVFRNRVAWLAALIAVSGVVYVGAIHVRNAPEWKTLIADVRSGVDIDGSQHWKDQARFPAPLNELGSTVNDSAYSRTAWGVAGVHLLGKYPMGYGVLQQSFGALAAKEWPDFHPPDGRTRGSTHSGWLDFALATGLPGITIIFVWMGVCWKRSLGQTGFWADVTKLSIPTIFLTYLLAEVCVDHFIELLFFLLALFSVVTQPKKLP